MKFMELDVQRLRAAAEGWSPAVGGVYYSDTIENIIQSNSYGNLLERSPYQAVYYGVEDEGRLLALVQIVVSGHGILKTVKVQDLLLAPGSSGYEKRVRVRIIVHVVVGILALARSLTEDGKRIRVVKIYGRSSEILSVLKVMAEDLADAGEETGFGIAMEGGWLSFYPVDSIEEEESQ